MIGTAVRRPGRPPVAGPESPAGGRTRRAAWAWPWVAVGTAATVAVAVAGAGIGAVPGTGTGGWVGLTPGRSAPIDLLFYGGAGLLVVAWWGLGHDARAGRLTLRRAWLVAGLWAGPLAVGPPLFSRDLYSYISQGRIAHAGLDPYAVGPAVLGPGSLLDSVAVAWRHSPAPYGPLFVTLSRWVAAGSGTSIVAAVLWQRALELVGVALLLWGLPRLARHHGADPATAVWLGVLSPLALFGFVASGHNDALMAGMVVAGLVLAVEGRRTTGLALCGLAATIKLPAALAVVFLAVSAPPVTAVARRLWGWASRLAVPAAVAAAVTAACGLGWGWLSPGDLRIPATSQVLPTPSVALGTLVFHVVRLGHGHVAEPTVIRAVQLALSVGGALVVVALAARGRSLGLVAALGLALLVVAVAGPALWPWYLLWGAVLLATTAWQRQRWLAVLVALSMFMVGPAGNPVLHGAAYLGVVLALAVLVVLAVGRWRRHRRGGGPDYAAEAWAPARRDSSAARRWPGGVVTTGDDRLRPA